jgi:hypothetical protein
MATQRLLVSRIESQFDGLASQFKHLRALAVKGTNQVIHDGHQVFEELKPREQAMRQVIEGLRAASEARTDEICAVGENAWKDLVGRYHKVLVELGLETRPVRRARANHRRTAAHHA